MHQTWRSTRHIAHIIAIGVLCGLFGRLRYITWVRHIPAGNAQDYTTTGQTLLWPEACNASPTVTGHSIDFLSFNNTNVLSSSYTLTGQKDLPGNTISTAVYQHYLSGQNASTSTHTGYMLTIEDACANSWRLLTVKISDMSWDNQHTIPSDAIGMILDGIVYYIGDTEPLLNTGIEAFAFSTWGVSMEFGTQSYGNTGIWDNKAKSIEILSRPEPTNLMYGEFGIDATFFIEVPRRQPSGSYSGTITLDIEPRVD